MVIEREGWRCDHGSREAAIAAAMAAAMVIAGGTRDAGWSSSCELKLASAMVASGRCAREGEAGVGRSSKHPWPHASRGHGSSRGSSAAAFQQGRSEQRVAAAASGADGGRRRAVAASAEQAAGHGGSARRR